MSSFWQHCCGRMSLNLLIASSVPSEKKTCTYPCGKERKWVRKRWVERDTEVMCLWRSAWRSTDVLFSLSVALVGRDWIYKGRRGDYSSYVSCSQDILNVDAWCRWKLCKSVCRKRHNSQPGAQSTQHRHMVTHKKERQHSCTFSFAELREFFFIILNVIVCFKPYCYHGNNVSTALCCDF